MGDDDGSGSDSSTGEEVRKLVVAAGWGLLADRGNGTWVVGEKRCDSCPVGE
jgi:hypothetical protein